MAASSADFGKFTDIEKALCVQANRMLAALCRLPDVDSLQYLGWETCFYGEIVKTRELQKKEPSARVHALLVSALLCYARSSSSPIITGIRAADSQILNSPYHRSGLCYLELNSSWGYGDDTWWTDFAFTRDSMDIMRPNGQTTSNSSATSAEEILGKRPRPTTPDIGQRHEKAPELPRPSTAQTSGEPSPRPPRKRARRVPNVSQSELVNSVKVRTSECSRKARSPGGAPTPASRVSQRMRNGSQRTPPTPSRHGPSEVTHEASSEDSEDDERALSNSPTGLSASAVQPKKFLEDTGCPTIFTSLVPCQKCCSAGIECKFDLRVSHICLICIACKIRCSLNPGGDSALFLATKYHALLFKLESDGVDRKDFPQLAKVAGRPESGVRKRRIYFRAGKLTKEARAAIVASVKAEIAQRPGKTHIDKPGELPNKQKTTGRVESVSIRVQSAAAILPAAKDSSRHDEQTSSHFVPGDQQPAHKVIHPTSRKKTNTSRSLLRRERDATAARPSQDHDDPQQPQSAADEDAKFCKFAETILRDVDSRLHAQDERMAELFADLKGSFKPAVHATAPSVISGLKREKISTPRRS